MSSSHWPELSSEAVGRVEAALAKGNKIEAIKIYREATGLGLKESKEAIERAKIVQTFSQDQRVKGVRLDSNWLLIVMVLAGIAVVLVVVLLILR
jgi:hypothetical protein